MGWQFTLYAVPPLAAALISAVLVRYAYRHRTRPTAPLFLLLMGAIAAWSFVYGLQVGFNDRLVQETLLRLGITIGATIPTIWLFLTVRYAQRDAWLSPARTLVLVAEPAVFTIALWTNPIHRFVWNGFVVQRQSPSLLDFVPGLGYWLHITYAYLLVVAGIGLLLSVYFTGSRINRRQSGLLVVGAVVPLSANVLFTLGASPIAGLDLTTFSFTLTGVVFAFALYRYDLLDLAPAAYRSVSDVLGDGILAFDRDGALVEYNDRAAGILDAPVSVGTDWTDLLPGDVLTDVSGTTIATNPEDGRRFYELRHATLDDRTGQTAGHLFVLEEVTATKEYEQRLEVTNRVLRHNLRNEMNVVAGRAEHLQATLSEGTESLERIREATDRLSAVSEKARFIQSSMHHGDGDLTGVDVVPIATTLVDHYDETHPDATVTLDAPARARVRTDDAESVQTALDNLVENAIEHHDTDDPTVAVTVERGEEWVTVRVADDGPGIPKMERAPVVADEETQLEHGSGLGLWLAKWAVTAAGGTITFEENEPRGSVVMLRFRPADDGGE